MNARNYLYIQPYNKPAAKAIADDKLETKKILLEHGIATPTLYAVFEDRQSIQRFDWYDLPQFGFVVKPTRGFGGGGILPIRKFEESIATTVTGEEMYIDQITQHIYDILEGGFSLQYLPDRAFIEERLVPHPMFKKLGAVGIPDIRIIVFHSIPVMAMIRFPTEKSGGKANISLGALGFGIDMRTGITTGARSKYGDSPTIPGSKVKTRGIKIPNWDDLLLLAAKTQAVCGLGYAGIDIVIDKDNKPQVLEVNARPGLEIQNINKDSLRARLERIEHIPTPSPERGVEVAKSLFAESFSEKVQSGPKVLSLVQKVMLAHKDKSMEIEAKIDTGNYRTIIDKKVAEELGLEPTGETVEIVRENQTMQTKLYKVTLTIAGKKATTGAIIEDRSNQRYPITIGRLNVRTFLLRPVLDPENPEQELSDIIENAA